MGDWNQSSLIKLLEPIITISHRGRFFSLVILPIEPNRPGHKFRASRQGDRQILCISRTSCDEVMISFPSLEAMKTTAGRKVKS